MHPTGVVPPPHPTGVVPDPFRRGNFKGLRRGVGGAGRCGGDVYGLVAMMMAVRMPMVKSLLCVTGVVGSFYKQVYRIKGRIVVFDVMTIDDDCHGVAGRLMCLCCGVACRCLVVMM